MDRLDDTVRQRVAFLVASGPHSRGDLLAVGATDPDLRRLERRGHLRRTRGQYAIGTLAPDLADVACCIKAFTGATASHLTAARLHRLSTWVDDKRVGAPPRAAVWLTRSPGSSHNERGPAIVLRRATLRSDEVAMVGRIPVTAPARTVVDLARELPLREAVVTVDHALTTVVTRRELEAALSRQAGWPGVRRARAAVTLGDPRSESVLESIARVAFAAGGLPPPVLQASFWDGNRWAGERVDFWWPRFRTFAEADGLAKYEAATPRERRDLQRKAFQREQRLADHGLEMVRFGWEDAVLEPDDLCERLDKAFARGSTRTGRAPRWQAPDPDDPRLWPVIPPDDA